MNQITNEELIEELQRLDEEVDGRPTGSDMDIFGEYSSGPYYDRWNSWSEALEEAGLSTERGISKERLIEALQKLDEEMDRTPRTTDMDELGEYSYATYRKFWDTWAEVLEDSGIDAERGVSREELIRNLQKINEEVDGVPRTSDVEDFGEYSYDMYSSRWETWNEILVEGGIEPDLDEKVGEWISREDLIDEMQRLTDELGHPPTSTEMDDLGEYSYSVYYNRWGSWAEAKEAAGVEE